MATVSRPRSDFVTSGGAVGFDRLQMQIEQDPAITTAYLGGSITPADASESIDMIFKGPLSAPEIAALDSIVAKHNGENVAEGSAFLTKDSFLSGGNAIKQTKRLATGDGFLKTVIVESSVAASSTVVRMLINGSPTGSGAKVVLPAGTPTQVQVPIDEATYFEDEIVGIQVEGLDTSATSTLEGIWSEGA